MKTIKDSVHGHIDVDGIARDLLDCPLLQRLRRIKQLGTVSLVYPSANHTRFEHSLGVYHLAGRVINQLPAHEDEIKRVQAAALVHDIGHAPFSHNIENIIERHTGRGHDDIEWLLGDTAIKSTLNAYDIGIDEVAALVRGEGRFGGIIASELDADRMDYLVRDAHHTGVPYGTIDHERLVRAVTIRDGQLVLEAGNVETAESLLIARALMNPTVYNHHVARISKSMLRRGAQLLLESTDVSATDLQLLDDPAFRSRLRSCSATAEYARRFDHRELFKRAVWAELDNVPDRIVDADVEQYRTWEREIAVEAGVDNQAVILDVPDRPRMAESGTRVVVSGEVRRLDEQSPLVDALRAAQRTQWRLGIYAPPGETDAVGHAAVSVLGMDLGETLVSEGPGRPTTLERFSTDESGN